MLNKKIKSFFFFLIFSSIYSQKVLKLEECELALKNNNLQLIAQQYNIEVSKAQIIQAKIWQQPLVSGEVNLYNPEKKLYFDVGVTGQKAFAIQQLIYMGGKKRNEVAFAKSNSQLAELQFEQVMLSLKYQLAQSFSSVYFDNQKIKVINEQIEKLESLLSAYNEQAKKGNVSLKDVVRLQTLVLGLKNDKVSITKDIISNQQTLSLITGISEVIEPNLNEKKILDDYSATFFSKEDMKKKLIENNPEYLWTQKMTESQELYLKWQRSLNTPDVTLGGSYDQTGGAFKNQVNLTFAVPLPLWRQNKGNVAIAKAQLEQSKTNLEYKKQELENSLDTAYLIWQQYTQQYKTILEDDKKELEAVYEGIVQNFERRNITLLEFTDFMESYNEAVIQKNEIKKQWVISGIGINYITNSQIFK
ncbi:TolC family protein [Flavobacterium columnare]|uniref:Outer membrane efflux protein n=1 Tax=Flavobacterium columnare (strain ATCC 49512 / CIP 103533 / TG 44/87) TaxID=1041826 RepID=G8X8V0_FLACA|nr:TolC family protein [Flavobacterium columnare]AEW87183.1 outer membrane efflux protein [Flavobacterium columnare ATCC 49512]MBF6651320.1 TolC family protein [Flavobacterium columnare]PTD14612.1 TolC family protein [Flavobacterium columnare]